MKEIYLVYSVGEYPEKMDKIMLAKLKNELPARPYMVIGGIGQSYLNTAKMYGLKLEKHNKICGFGDVLNKPSNRPKIDLGKKISLITKGRTLEARKLIENSENYSVLIIDGLFLLSLGLIIEPEKIIISDGLSSSSLLNKDKVIVIKIEELVLANNLSNFSSAQITIPSFCL